MNGDGYADVIVGVPEVGQPRDNEGRAYVYHGSATGLSATAAWTAEGNQATAEFGHAVGTAGDVNGDGYADVVVGAPVLRQRPDGRRAGLRLSRVGDGAARDGRVDG